MKSGQKTILAVDDDPFILDIVSRYLSAKGFRVLTTTDPESALAMATEELPQLVISDIAMPGMNGLTLLKHLKEGPVTRDIPIVLLTSSNRADDIHESFSTGAEAYLLKPVDWVRDWPKLQNSLWPA